jgi:predicted phage tail protein
MIHEFRNPIPVITSLGEGYAIYVRDSGTWENDIWAIALQNSTIRHFRTDQIKLHSNATFDITNIELDSKN